MKQADDTPRAAAVFELPHLVCEMPDPQGADGAVVIQLKRRDWCAAVNWLLSKELRGSASPIAVQHVDEIADLAEGAYQGDWYERRNVDAARAKSKSLADDCERGHRLDRMHGYRPHPIAPSAPPVKMKAAEQRRYAERLPATNSEPLFGREYPQAFAAPHPDELRRLRNLIRRFINEVGTRKARAELKIAWEKGGISPETAFALSEFEELGIDATQPNPYVLREQEKKAAFDKSEAELQAILEKKRIPNQRAGEPLPEAARVLKGSRGRPFHLSDRVAVRFAKQVRPLIFGNAQPGERSKQVQKITEWFLRTTEPERFDRASRYYRKPPSDHLYR